jgi:transposase
MEIYLIGIDTSKSFFQLCGVSQSGKTCFEKRLNRAEVKAFMRLHSKCIVAMEVGSAAHYWGRLFTSYGHEVRLIPAAYVKPYVKTQKNDRADAEAIAEAALRPNMRFVAIKSVLQQDIQNLHRVRERLVSGRTALVNQIRGLLAEYGIIFAQGVNKFSKLFTSMLSDESSELSSLAQNTFQALQEELAELNERIDKLNDELEEIHKAHPVCLRLAEVPGVGALTATAIIAAASAPQEFKNGRQFAASLGLVPRQHSSGGKQRLFGISKHGNSYIRKLLVHGARSVLLRVDKKLDDRSCWAQRVKARRGSNIASVALANKNARVIWALLTHPETKFTPTFKHHLEQLKAAAA